MLEPSGSKQVELMLDYFPNADHAGIYAAQAAGHFEQAGLDVTIRQPPDPAAPIKQVAAGRVDLAISYEPEVLRARDQGLSVVSVGAIVQKPLTSLISLPAAKISQARRPQGQDGRHRGDRLPVGLPPDDPQRGPGARRQRQGAQRRLLRSRRRCSPGKIDAVLGAFWNYEGTDLRLRGKRPRIIRMEEAGVPTYNELVLVANEDALERDGDKIRAFIGALSRGTRDLRADPGEAIEGLLDANPDLDPELQRAVVDVTLPLFFPPEGKPFGWQSPSEWDAFAAWMQDNNLLENPADVRAAYDNGLLPGSGL